ncbi:DUF2892 domain-containing protein [Azospirillum sp. RWY-5-1]|uniref:DUF2892 domain-containing protein n=1 Tax=Azospirillum oleiclasticum TaxID=2735135 RepID=A0ABX2T4P4_9PROT|nr:DUF2892 domain-containing protein [Azospirillum oleiclasticum]NYZ11084.1 DUF2892 domain-containing protein [Azospirillum oleiclasticum]NYZ18246.1 DUF2892 domain-containing protein [Azospirillum oleiclasticum]
MSIEHTLHDTYDRVFGGEANLGTVERVVSTGFGLALAAAGVNRGASWSGALMGLAGAALITRGMTGHCALKASLEDGQHEHRSIADRPDTGSHADTTPVTAPTL